MGIFLGWGFPGVNCPGGNHPGGDFLGGNFPSTNKHIIKMSKRKSVIVVHSDSTKVAPQISATTNVPVRQVNREELKVDWEKCFICQTETRETLESSSEA